MPHEEKRQLSRNTITARRIVGNLAQQFPFSDTTTLLLPGADTWADPKHGVILEKARTLLLQAGTDVSRLHRTGLL